MLQETHCNDQITEVQKKDWTGESYFSGNKTNKGVAFLIKNNSNIKIVNVYELITGRLLEAEITIKDKDAEKR